jgi:hypothetical protein
MTDDRSSDDSAADTERAETDSQATDGGNEASEAPIEADIVADAAADEDVPQADLVDVLVVLNASLIGSHATYEREYEYVTVDGVRGYVVDTAAWETLREEHDDLDSRLAAAAQRAHTEQTEQLLAADDDTHETIDAGIVVGIDTAEGMD